MKKITLAGVTLAMAMAMATGSAFAANGLTSGTLGLSVDTTVDPKTNFIISGKYVISPKVAVLAGFGLRMVDTGQPAPVKSKWTDLGFMGGARIYLNNNDLTPFVGGRLTYANTQDSNVTALQLMAEAGAEYFVGKQFSLEGRVGFGYTSLKTTAGATSTTATEIGSNAFALGANFYF